MLLLSPTVQSLLSQLTAAVALADSDYPCLQASFQATASKISATGGPQQVQPLLADADAVWQELIDGFEFVRGVHTAGLWSVVDLDVPAQTLHRAAKQQGFHWPVSGETTLIACLPLSITTISPAQPSFFQQLLTPLREALETIERQTIESS